MPSGHQTAQLPDVAAIQSAPGTTSRSRALSLVIAGALAGALLFYSLRGIEWHQVATIVAGARLFYLAVGMLMSTLTLLLRAIRWRILLNAEGSVTIPTAFWATAGGYFGNNFLPARGGEFVRTAMIASHSRLNAAYVLVTAISERIADAIALVTIATVVLFTLPVRPGWTYAAARPLAIVAIAGVLVIVLLPRFESFFGMVIQRVPMPHSIRTMATSRADHAFRGLRAFHDPRRFLAFLGLTAVIWSLDAVAAVLGGAALGFAIRLPVAFLLLASLGLGSALPSTPGYVGVYQFVAISVLTPFGFSRTDAIAYILVAQALNYLVIGFWGAWGFLLYRRSQPSATTFSAPVVVRSHTESEEERR
jgi:uncharacterized protein (TIRG00374 family)